MTTKTNNWLEEMAQEEIENEIKQEEWQDPIPMNSFDKLPSFPSEIIPTPGRDIIEAVATVNQVDKGMPGITYLAVLSACLAKKGIIDLGTHTEPLNIYGCNVAEVGMRKSQTQRDMTSPIYEYQHEREAAMKDVIIEAYNKRKIDEKRLDSLQKKAASTADTNERHNFQNEAAQLSIELNDSPIPKVPTYIVDDVSTEAIANIMADNDERLSVVSAEGGIFGIMAGRYNEKGGAHFDIYLKAHAGDPWSSHRIGREQKTMLSPALTMCLTVQPDVIYEIGNNPNFRGRGLPARFLFSASQSKAGYRERQHNSIPNDLLIAYKNFLKSLMDIPSEDAVFTLSSEAQSRWDEFYNDIEREMKAGQSLENLRDWGSKLAGAVARIAGLLHFAEYGSHASNKPISEGIVDVSCAIGAYLKEHALAVFGLMKEDPRIEAAKKIVEYLHAHKPETFKGRDILMNKNAFKAMDDVDPGLKILKERDYIRELPRPQGMAGRPQSTAFIVNPKIYTL